MRKEIAGWFGRVSQVDWLVGMATIVICGAIATPFVLSMFPGHGFAYHAAVRGGATHDDASPFVWIAILLGLWFVAVAGSKLITLVTEREGRLRSGWHLLVLYGAIFVTYSCVVDFIALKRMYAEAIALVGSMIVWHLIAQAFFGRRKDPSAHRDTEAPLQ